MNSISTIKKVLVGIDGSDYSVKALEFAFSLSKKYNSTLIAFTAFHVPEIYKLFKNNENYDSISIHDEITKSENLLKSIKERGQKIQIDIHTEFVNSDLTPAVAIIEYCKDNEVDHIVLGHRGRSIENLLIGNTANSVISKSICNVTVVK